tara:strand:- start:1298 stop:2098 length:801 start_codon:yes stop_codon:yes gene_type:complete
MLDTLSKKLDPIKDDYLTGLKVQFYNNSQQQISRKEFIGQADEWFRSSKLNTILGWDKFPHKDVILGCTHFIESTCLRYGWQIQRLPNEYVYYSMSGKLPTEIQDLKPNIPLIISIPFWQYTDVHPDWGTILKQCEERNIDIHIDGAWMQSARNIEFDFDHPNIKSFAMSMGKGIDINWNRIGLRWTKQRTVDSITMMNQFEQIHETAINCGSFLMKNIIKDYAWEKYSASNKKIAERNSLEQTNHCHVLKNQDGLYGIGDIIAKI